MKKKRRFFLKLYTPLKKYYGKWMVLGDRAPESILCRCECGVERFVRLGHLRGGYSTCCVECRIKKSTKHGEAIRRRVKSSEYLAWGNMIGRCENKKLSNYKDYGGRGIKVCKRWKKSFNNFLQDVGRKPSKKHSLERIDNDGDYKPSNVKWATPLEQAANRRTNIWYKIDGKKYSIRALASLVKIPYQTISSRLKGGLTINEALTIPKRARKIINEIKRKVKKSAMDALERGLS